SSSAAPRWTRGRRARWICRRATCWRSSSRAARASPCGRAAPSRRSNTTSTCASRWRRTSRSKRRGRERRSGWGRGGRRWASSGPKEGEGDMRVEPVACLSDNYAYLIIDERAKQVSIVDASEPAPVLAAIERVGLPLAAILSTHHHGDHVGGNE